MLILPQTALKYLQAAPSLKQIWDYILQYWKSSPYLFLISYSWVSILPWKAIRGTSVSALKCKRSWKSSQLSYNKKNMNNWKSMTFLTNLRTEVTRKITTLKSRDTDESKIHRWNEICKLDENYKVGGTDNNSDRLL